MQRLLLGPALELVLLCIGMALSTQQSILAQEPASPAPFGRYTENINGVTLELVRIPNGKFIMGNDRSPNSEEKPAHQVSLTSIYIGQYEITRKQYNIVATSLPKIYWEMRSQYISPNANEGFVETTPADVIFWDAAVEFCNRVERFTGKKYRLPSEAEWEYACRAGTDTEYSFGDQVNYSLAHFKNLGTPAFYLFPVGGKGYFNNWGIADLHGNVAEWCLDDWHSNYIGAPTDGRAWIESGNGARGILRGGMYDLHERIGRSTARFSWSKSGTVSGVGFRVVLEANAIIGASSIAATSAANYAPNNLSANSLGSLFGEKLAAETKVAESLPLPTTLAGCSVFVKDVLGNEHLANLLFVSPTQINFQLPADLPIGNANIYAVLNGNIHSSGTLNITPISPGLFTADATGKGWAAAVVQRIKRNGKSTYEPITRFDAVLNRIVALPIDVSQPDEEVFLALFGTGIRGRSSLANVTAKVGATDVEILYAGVQPDFVGLDQINLRLPRSLSGSGEVIINLNVEGLAANPVKIQIR